MAEQAKETKAKGNATKVYTFKSANPFLSCVSLGCTVNKLYA